MSDNSWEVVEVVPGQVLGEILRGLLEAQGIPVFLSQEGAGHFGYPATVGLLGRVEILVPVDSVAHAREILNAYHSGAFDTPGDEEV